ncbi:MarR family winged helix-turn-helix transcriptional regulator [Pigmentiphaga litoralis]|uniref:DNA-binding MarR family transcriptional regulator n=1 Tax=Pigmentiphaga litoralis TaxID=516702 RepID=A0A7Y9IV11_9BURK|nr:MarR family transcriptional regulator [Pigmentiphaga litoralis]NYE23368.1 DNA-binding MarR family transcriptional regulator [Pigmentiphaga litoralis]NYE83018.1 DNA-binding MarR family transcriptional regulator [Pigmentiphaga litoralis]
MVKQSSTPPLDDDAQLRQSLSRYNPDDSVGYLVKQAHVLLQRAVDAEMTAIDLTAMQWRPLIMLAMGMGDTAADLARQACVDTGAVTRMLDRLESKGLVRRVRSVEDRRVIKLELTPEGRQVAIQIPELLEAVMERLTRGFAADDIDQFKGFLRRMIANGESPAA